MKKGILAMASILIGGITGAVVTKQMLERTIDEKNNKINKFKGYYSLLNQWFSLKQEGKALEQYFVNNGYKTVAIYGMGEMGLRLYEELKNSKDVDIKYGIDQGAALCGDLEILTMEDTLTDVDVVVVTATFAFDEIEEKLGQKMNCSVISLDDVVYEI